MNSEILSTLPAPPHGKTGYPWTEGSNALPTSPPNGGKWIKISVITPSYNQGQFLEETIRSVLLQGYPNLEYILMDGGSTDNSLEIIQKYAPFITQWVSQKDKGQADAINQGLGRSTGAVMGWLNSDDLLLPNALQHIAKAFHQHHDWSVVCGFRQIIDSDSKLITNSIRGLPHSYQLKHRNIIAQETTYWRRKVWEKLGQLDETLHYCMDYEYWQRMLANGYDFNLLPAYIGCIRYHDSSKTISQNARFKRDLEVIYQRYGIAMDEDTALAKMGRLWQLRYDLTKDLCHQPIFQNPHLALRILKLIEQPLLSPPILGAYALYRRWRKAGG